MRGWPAWAPGRTGLHPYLDNFVRLSRVPLVTISALRGRARGAGSEFALATDIRFAGDRAVLGQSSRSGVRLRLVLGALQQWDDEYLHPDDDPTLLRRHVPDGRPVRAAFVDSDGPSLDAADVSISVPARPR